MTAGLACNEHMANNSGHLIRSYKYRLYPNGAQEAALSDMLGHFCDLCNAGLQQRIEAWRRQGVSLRCTDQANELKAVRDAVPELAGYSCSAGQQVLRRLDKAFAAFFRRVKAGETPGLSPAFARNRGSTAPTSASATGWSAGTDGSGSSGSRTSSRSGGIASCPRGRRTRSSAARTGSGS